MNSVETKRFFLLALDPLHIGSGERSLGRIDLPVVRDPSTQVPKIPGTSLSGVVRSNAALLYGKKDCAGQGSRDASGEGGHCGQLTCPICYTFGSLRVTMSGSDASTSTYAGVVRIYDAHLLFCPVPSSIGPVWVTTPQRLEEAAFGIQKSPDKESVLTTFDVSAAGIDLGWLLLPVTGKIDIKPPASPGIHDFKHWGIIKEHIAVVDETLYGPVVNANLEVRTSVSIDPLTGAAAHGALFTYEAIPRLSWLYTDVVLDPYRADSFPKVEKKAANGKDDAGDPLSPPWHGPMDLVRLGLRLGENLGIGGMGTRGFGRVKLVWEVNP